MCNRKEGERKGKIDGVKSTCHEASLGRHRRKGRERMREREREREREGGPTSTTPTGIKRAGREEGRGGGRVVECVPKRKNRGGRHGER